MFKRLYAVGGVWYVLGGVGAIGMASAVVVYTLLGFGFSLPEKVSTYSFYAFCIGGLIVTLVFNSGNMQVVAQNRTTEVLERISQQLEERGTDNNKGRHRPVCRQVVQNGVFEEEGIPCAEGRDRVESPIVEKAAHQEGYRCPVTKAVIPVRD